MNEHFREFTSRETDEMVLLSIRPEHALKILSGEKKLEFRRVWATRPVSSLAIYVTVPIKKIVAIVSVKRVHRGNLRSIWEVARSIGGGLTKAEFLAYFEGKSEGYAIQIDHVYQFSVPIDPYEYIDNFRAPQSFSYVAADIKKSLWREFGKQSDTASRTLYFVGGVHGVGKSTMCKIYASSHDAVHISAGALIRQGKNDFVDISEKIVGDIADNQRLLIAGIAALPAVGTFIMDGHFAVLNSERMPTPIDLSVFQDLGISGVIVVVDNPSEISNRIENRDRRYVSARDVAKLQRLERKRGEEVAQALNIPFATVTSGDKLGFESAINVLRVK